MIDRPLVHTYFIRPLFECLLKRFLNRKQNRMFMSRKRIANELHLLSLNYLSKYSETIV